MNRSYLLLGSNMGNRLDLLEHARRLISRNIGKVTQTSSIYETESWGFISENMFLNQVLLVETELLPEVMLDRILDIEKSLGRERSGEKYSSRSIDIDILFYGDQVIDQSGLVIPHPRIQDRLFTLIPLNEIDPGMIHPLFKKTIRELLEECNDHLKVSLYHPGATTL
jgi:2-amino-4-hydroxy-6-hydroxymethyldihydropteridine diphosphokinase